MSKAKLIEVINLNAKNNKVELESNNNVWYLDFNIVKNEFIGYIYRVSKKTKNNNERIFENSNSFFNALTNILENQNVRVLTENKSKINTIK